MLLDVPGCRLSIIGIGKYSKPNYLFTEESL